MFYPSTGQAFHRPSLPRTKPSIGQAFRRPIFLQVKPFRRPSLQQTKPSAGQFFYKSSLKPTSVLSLWKGAL